MRAKDAKKQRVGALKERVAEANKNAVSGAASPHQNGLASPELVPLKVDDEDFDDEEDDLDDEDLESSGRLSASSVNGTKPGSAASQSKPNNEVKKNATLLADKLAKAFVKASDPDLTDKVC